ncbi:MAG: hypothetical protein FJZ63_01770 [Chlamydiae bacterium]|nr:hypothetical protein [Chlamydiota bacterium]
MTSLTSSNSSPSRGVWSSASPYMAPPVAAAAAIVPAYYDMAAKSAMQKGLPPPSMTFKAAVKGGLETAPSVGALVGAQMVLQGRVEQGLAKTFPNLFAEDSKASLTLASSALAGGLSSPFVAVYNGKTMTPPWSVRESLSKFSLKQAGAITLQETCFVAGLAAADPVAKQMKQTLGDNKAVDYLAAASTGALGSLAGHPGNTALTRWQNAMAVDSLKTLSLGSLRKARGNAVFAVAYKLGKEALYSTAEGEN